MKISQPLILSSIKKASVIKFKIELLKVVIARTYYNTLDAEIGKSHSPASLTFFTSSKVTTSPSLPQELRT